MSDLPPSYEAATGSPAAQPCFNATSQPSAPPQPSAPSQGQINTIPQHTTTIAMPPQTTLSPQNLPQHPPYPVQASHPTSIPTPQTNAIFCRRRRPNKTDRKCMWIIVAIVIVAVIGLIVALIAIKTVKKASEFHDTFQSVYGQPEYPKFDWDKFNTNTGPKYPEFDWDTFNKNNQELLDRLNSKMYKMPLDFN